MGKMQKEKGKRGERELAKILREYGYECRRGQQFCGLKGNADVVGLPGIHIECKRVERINIYNAMKQAKNEANKNDFPAVFHRKNNHEWIVIMSLDDWINLYRKWCAKEKIDENIEE